MSEINIKHILTLANIRITDNEVVVLKDQFDKILNWLEIIEKVDTTGIEPMYNRLEDFNIFHIQDNVTEEENVCCVHSILKNAPESENQMIVVPKVINV